MMIKKYCFLLFLLVQSVVFAQSLETKIDTTKNKIGAQFTLTLKVKTKPSTLVTFPRGNNFGALEVIESYPIDTVKSDANYELIKKYGLTQFDSGKYVIPRLPVLFDKKPIFSDSIKVEVFNVKVDTLKQKMYDIKPIIAVEKPFGNWWKYLLVVILLCGLGYLGYYLWKKNRKPKQKEIVYNSPIEKATSLLQLLEKKELLEKGEVKEYYSELTDIARDYIEEAIEIPAKESTTSELIVALRAASNKKKMKLSRETLEGLEKVLKQADLVKFAKSKPLDFEIADDRKKIETTILTLDKAIPVIVDENSLKWQKEQQEFLKKQKRKSQLVNLAGITGFMLLFALTFVIITKGFDYVKGGFSGYSTKQLVNQDWIKSEYGNPSVVIETPEVLKRLDTKKAVPKDAMALIKDMQMFGFGSILDHFTIVVSTTQFKNKPQEGDESKQTGLDLGQALNGTIETMEAQGCQNMIVKQEEFSTEQGIKGIKGYGTMTANGEKMYYQILLFSQAGGLQQIMIAHKEGDENAQKISERMLNSVELKLAN
ncbi:MULTISPECIES: BatD family protein [Flavobacterium]